MLKLRDFFHLSEVDDIVAQLVRERSGLMVVAGPDLRTLADSPGGGGLLTSGRSGIFNILIQEILGSDPEMRATYVTQDKTLARPARELRNRVTIAAVEKPLGYAERIKAAMNTRPGLLVIDQLNTATIPLAFKAAGSGLRVFSQFDSILWGPAIARQLVDMGANVEDLAALRWVLAVLRHATLCKDCRMAQDLADKQWVQLRQRFPHLSADLDKLRASNEHDEALLYTPGGCARCKGSGRRGDITAFDIFRLDGNAKEPFSGRALMPIEKYLLHLAEGGQVPLEDLLDIESNLLRSIYSLLYNREIELSQSTTKLKRKLVELEAANRVLEQRTEVVFSLQEMGHALISSHELEDLAARVCRYASQICGAERAVLYYLRSGEEGKASAEVLAANGWGDDVSGMKLDAWIVFPQSLGRDALPYRGRPPGIREEDFGDEDLHDGLLVPLVAQDQLVGLMIVHSPAKDPFPPGVVSLLQSFANQAALAMQRAGLIEELRQKIHQLEAAHAELVLKERMERELELARQVQQSLLPHTFPEVNGFEFAVRSQPARQVGGDFYDIFNLDEDHIGLLIADVSDRGMPAAVYMALTRSLLLAEARRELSPREVLQSVNHLLRELGEPNMFVSVFYAVVNVKSRQCTYARAGHDRPLIIRGGEIHHLSGQGAVLGTLDDANLRLSEEGLELQAGDRFVLFTDGLTDAVDGSGDFFGKARLHEALSSRGGLAAGELCVEVFKAIKTFQGDSEQFDDMTMVVVEVRAR